MHELPALLHLAKGQQHSSLSPTRVPIRNGTNSGSGPLGKSSTRWANCPETAIRSWPACHLHKLNTPSCRVTSPIGQHGHFPAALTRHAVWPSPAPIHISPSPLKIGMPCCLGEAFGGIKEEMRERIKGGGFLGFWSSRRVGKIGQ